ncbi:MAG: endonuclease [Betaproteobacteria bacterium HGW-Betaproteobacteria-16]|nr:MAG: endonuclease [Betaproteobacteria bacterium HGW-Betaproteobacteria-16]
MTTYFVAFWNLENLFAPEDFLERVPWLAEKVANDLNGWTPELFERKIEQLVRIIQQMNAGTGPDLLGVCEVENQYVLQTLAERLNTQLPGRHYEVVHADAERDQRGIDTAFLHDIHSFTANLDEFFSHWVMRRTGTRDISQCTFVTAAGNDLVVQANHWPSRSAPTGAGSQYSAGFRATAGETLSYWHERIREEKGAEVALLSMGDFNDDPFDLSLMVHAVALRELGDVERAQSAKLFNLSWSYLSQPAVDHQGNPRNIDGTLYFSGDGNVFDQILVSRGLLTGPNPLKVRPGSARIEAIADMVDHRVSLGPIRFGLPKGKAAENVNPDGFSDHFPVSVLLDEA